MQPVGFHRLVVEPRTVTSLPFVAANHAELGRASAGHVVASLLEFNHRRAIEAALPAFLLGNVNKYLGGRVLGTLSRRVHFIVADTADPGPASLAFSYLASILETNVIGLDPFATVASRAVDAVSGSVLLEFSVPGLFELLIE